MKGKHRLIVSGRLVMGLVTVLVLLTLPLFGRWGLKGGDVQAGMVVGSGITAAGGNCATTEIVPTYTQQSTNWTASSGTILDAIAYLIASRQTTTYDYIQDTVGNSLRMRFDLPGNCNVTAIRAEIYIESTGASGTANVSVSNDNSTYTSTQSINLANSTPTAAPVTFSALSWTNPTYVYVKIQPTSTTNEYVRVYDLSATVNP